MYRTQFFDSSFDINKCHNYRLSIQLSLDGFSFCIYDNLAQQFIYIAEKELNTTNSYQLLHEIESIFNVDSTLKQSFESVIVSFQTNRYTNIPNSLFSNQDIESFFYALFPKKRDEQIIKYSGRNLDYVTIFSFPDSILHFFNNLPTTVKIVPPCCSFSSITLSNQLFVPMRLTIHFEMHLMHVNVFDSAKLLFHNTFYVKNDIDKLYYIILIFEKLNLDQLKTVVEIDGKIHRESPLFGMLKKYIANVNLRKFSINYQVSDQLQAIEQHIHVNLFEQALCE